MAVMRRAVLALLVVAAVAAAAAGEEIVKLSVRGSINPVTAGYVVRGLARAAESGAVVVVLVLDTPGGLDSSTQDIVQAILGSAVPVAVWVGPPGARAASAGTFVLLAAHVAAMAPGTSVGAAHPVSLTGNASDADDPTMEKAVIDAAARIRSIAQLRGRNAAWAEEAVRASVTATASEALRLGVIEVMAGSFPELIDELEGRQLPDGSVLHVQGRPVRAVEMSLKDRLFSYLADPNLVYILLMLGLYGLIYEFFSPGIGIGLAVGGISLLLALMGLQVLPINFAGVGLILFGVLLMVLDAFTPTDGILTTGGVVSLLVGSFSLFEIDSPVIGLSWYTVSATVGTLTAILAFIITKGLLAQRRRPVRAQSTMAGLSGVAKVDLRPDGWVMVRGEYWRARAEGDSISAGEEVVVIAREGRRLTVRRRRPPS
ncbi:MAG: NfeD family protein [Candidatus Bipolaricaulaceae bacterium]